VVAADGWNQTARGPTLRRLFGGYQNQDCWAVYRKYREIDDGDGYVSYEELQQAIKLAEFNLLFIWDLFSQQNELINSKELLTVVCVFSSARLEEKGRFLMSLFDDSHTGICTGAEIAQISVAVLGVLAKCSGTVVKAKEVVSLVRQDLPGLMPEYKKIVKDVGEEAAFTKERLVGHNELDKLLTSLRAAYGETPMSESPPDDAAAPPPPDWGEAKGKERKPRMNNSTNAVAGGGSSAVRNLAASRSAKKLPENELSHLAWMSRLDDEPGSGEKENLVIANSNTLVTAPLDKVKPVLAAAHSWMVVHGAEFASIAKDLAGFRRLFIRSVSQSLGVPSGCIEVINVSHGSIVIEFKIHPANRGGDMREASALVLLLEQQLGCPHSALRRGPLGFYAESAELLAGEPKRAATPPGHGTTGSVPQCDQAVQTDPSELGTPRPTRMKSTLTLRKSTSKASLDPEVNQKVTTEAGDVAARLQEALKELELMKHRAERAEAELRQRDSVKFGASSPMSDRHLLR